METVKTRRAIDHELPDKEDLYVVWVDTNMGFREPDWEMNSAPKPLPAALVESFSLKMESWPSIILPDGETPREDGRFSNPTTD